MQNGHQLQLKTDFNEDAATPEKKLRYIKKGLKAVHQNLLENTADARKRAAVLLDNIDDVFARMPRSDIPSGDGTEAIISDYYGQLNGYRSSEDSVSVFARAAEEESRRDDQQLTLHDVHVD